MHTAKESHFIRARKFSGTRWYLERMSATTWALQECAGKGRHQIVRKVTPKLLLWDNCKGVPKAVSAWVTKCAGVGC